MPPSLLEPTAKVPQPGSLRQRAGLTSSVPEKK